MKGQRNRHCLRQGRPHRDRRARGRLPRHRHTVGLTLTVELRLHDHDVLADRQRDRRSGSAAEGHLRRSCPIEVGPELDVRVPRRLRHQPRMRRPVRHRHRVVRRPRRERADVQRRERAVFNGCALRRQTGQACRLVVVDGPGSPGVPQDRAVRSVFVCSRPVTIRPLDVLVDTQSNNRQGVFQPGRLKSGKNHPSRE